jgi:hypothetical protein
MGIRNTDFKSTFPVPIRIGPTHLLMTTYINELASVSSFLPEVFFLFLKVLFSTAPEKAA